MQFKIQLPKNFQSKTVKELLEGDWLVPRKVRHFLRTRKGVLVNQKPLKWHEKVQALDIIELQIEDSDYQFSKIPFGDAAFADILYEDEHFVIVNKPENMKTHGNQPNELALQNHVSKKLMQQVFVVHRLDMATSGVVLFAKNPFVLPILGRMLEQKKIKRQYLALVDGKVNQAFTINKGIGKHRNDKRKRVVDIKNGQTAITHITPVKQFKKSTLVNCDLETGRTHQIRVHLENNGTPIIGDPLYHPKPKGRLMLHAQVIEFTHPFSQEIIKMATNSKTFDKNLSALK